MVVELSIARRGDNLEQTQFVSENRPPGQDYGRSSFKSDYIMSMSSKFRYSSKFQFPSVGIHKTDFLRTATCPEMTRTSSRFVCAPPIFERCRWVASLVLRAGGRQLHASR